MPTPIPSDPQPPAVSVWQLKPWWCQPWSILLTGFGSIGGSWWLWHRVWVTGVVAVPMLTWMGFFLLVYPALYARYESAQSEAEES